MRALREVLRPDGKVVVVDFHRDPTKMKGKANGGHDAQWALDHIRGTQAEVSPPLGSNPWETPRVL